MLVGDVFAAGGLSVALDTAYVSTCLTNIGYVALCDELWLLVLEVIPLVLDAVV